MSEEDKAFIEERARLEGTKPTVYARQLLANAITDIKRREAAAANIGTVSVTTAEEPPDVGPFVPPKRKWYQRIFDR